MHSIGYSLLQAYGRLLLAVSGSRRGRTPGSREPEWWSAMLGDLEPVEPEGERRAAWRYLDVALTGARERIVAHRAVAHVDEVAIFSDRTVVLHRCLAGEPDPAAVAQATSLLRGIGRGEDSDVDALLLRLVRHARSLDGRQRSLLRRLFADVGYPPIDPTTLSGRVALLLQGLMLAGSAPV